MNLKSFCLAAAFAGCLALIWADGQAGPAPADSTARKRFVLDPVRVIADRPTEAIGAVHRVEFAREKEPSALNLYEGLQDIGGISNTAGTRDESNLRIRGFRKNEVKLLIDGRPLNSGYFGNVDLHQLAPADIREILIIKGPGSSAYGPGSLGGVVNIITADPDESSWGRVSLLAKRNNSNRVALSSAHRIGNFGYRIYAARENNGGMVLSRDFAPTPFENGGVRNHSRKAQYDFQSRLDWHLSEFQTLGLSAGLAYVPEKLIAASVHELDYRVYEDWLRSWASLAYEGIAGEFVNLSAHAYYDGGQDTYKQYNDAAHQFLNVDSDMKYATLGLSPRLQWSLNERNSLDLGLRAENLRSNRKDNGSYPDWTPHWFNLFSTHAQWEHRLGGALTFSAGLGLSSQQLDSKQAPGLHAEPTLGLYWQPGERSESSLSLGKNTSFPTLRQLYSAENGNPDLLPQSALKLELDHRQNLRLGKLLLSNRLSLFYNDIRDLIDRVGESYQNIHRMKTWGAEYELMAAPWPWWELKAGYACLFGKEEQGYRLTESPRNTLTFSQDWQLPAKIRLSHTSFYSDLRLSQDSSENYHTLPSYWRHDLSLGRKFGPLKATLGLENIFDANYETEYGYPAPGLNFFLSLSAEI